MINNKLTGTPIATRLNDTSSALINASPLKIKSYAAVLKPIGQNVTSLACTAVLLEKEIAS
jgi:hypothetical protein